MTLDSIRQEVYDVAKQAALDALREHDQGRTLEPLLSIARVAELLGYPKGRQGQTDGDIERPRDDRQREPPRDADGDDGAG